MRDVNQLIRKVEERLHAFEALPSVTCKLDETTDGQFRIDISREQKNVVISHAWGNPTFSFANPGTIDMFLSDGQTLGDEAYAIIMTECDLKAFPELLREALGLTQDFLANRYTLEKRGWSFLAKKDIVFDSAGTYKIASRVR